MPAEGTEVQIEGVHDGDTVTLKVTCEGVDVLRGCKAVLRG